MNNAARIPPPRRTPVSVWLAVFATLACRPTQVATAPLPAGEVPVASEAPAASDPLVSRSGGTKLPAGASAGLAAEPASGYPALAQLRHERAALEGTMALPSLSSPDASAGYEVRVWLRRNERRLLLRVWEHQGKARGAAYVWWHHSRNSHFIAREIDDWVDCPTVTQTRAADLEYCRVHFPAGHDFGRTLARLEAAKVWTLPDMYELPEPPGGRPAADSPYEVMLVEAREGMRSRAYHYQDYEDVDPSHAGVAEFLALREALWLSFDDAQWPYDKAGEPIKARNPAPAY